MSLDLDVNGQIVKDLQLSMISILGPAFQSQHLLNVMCQYTLKITTACFYSYITLL